MSLVDGNGDLIYEGNIICKYNGTSNQGRIANNVNGNFNINNSTVQLLKSVNTKVDAADSTVSFTEDVNCNFFVRSSKIETQSNSTTHVEAKNVWGKFERNSNIDFKGEEAMDLLSEFIHNSTCHFTGNSNHIVALDNANLTVEGSNNKLRISKTSNHRVEPASELNRNSLAIAKCGLNNICYTVKYAGDAVINERNYQLGIINFSVVESTNMVNVSLDAVADVTYSVVETSASKIVIQGEKNAVVQMLELQGQRVEPVSPTSINILC